MKTIFLLFFSVTLLFSNVSFTDFFINSFKTLSTKDSLKEDFTANSDDDLIDDFDMEEIAPSWDPLAPYNVVMTDVNDFLYIQMLSPISKGYSYVVPKPARNGVSNFFHNLQFPIRFVNNILQFKFHNAFEETSRFIINSTFGVFGFYDFAYKFSNIEKHEEDLGQTLGYYGVSDDIHIVLPFFGPSNLRDTVGLIGDSFLNPFYLSTKQDLGVFENDETYLFLDSYKMLNEFSLHVEEYKNIRKDSVDLYTLLKSFYEQRRVKLIEE